MHCSQSSHRICMISPITRLLSLFRVSINLGCNQLATPSARKIIRWYLIIFLFPFLLQAANAPTGLLCDLLEHPEQTVITTGTPNFGWVYNPSCRNDSQAGYRIIVASTLTLANQGAGDRWDSGIVRSAASINVPYAGAALQPSTNYYWCVQTADGGGQTSPFSAVQQFNTDTQLSGLSALPVTTNGLEWIWYPESPAATNATRYFLRTFVIPPSSGVAGAQMLLTADDQFTLYLNGTLVGSGTTWKQFDLFSLNSLLQAGTNTIAIAVTNIGGAAGLTGRLDYLGADGSTNTVFIDGTWLASSNLVANWNQPGFNDSAWVNALVEGNYGVAPWDTTATLPFTTLYYNVSTNYWANRYPIQYVPFAPVLVTNTAPGDWFVDFGQDAFGYATVHANGAFNGTVVQANFSEMANGFTVTNAPAGSSVRCTNINFTLQNGNIIYPVHPPNYQRPSYAVNPPANYGVVLPFRYFELTNFPGTLTATDVVQERLLDDFNPNAAAFSSSSPALNQIWNLCRNSMQILTFDGIYADGDRERSQSEGDACIHQLSLYAVDREFIMLRYTFERLVQRPTTPTEWILQMVFIAWADYLQTGNADLLNKYYGTLQHDSFTWKATGNGLMQGFPLPSSTTNADIVDWPPSDRDGFVFTSGSFTNWTNSVNNAYYYHDLQLMGNIASVLGRTNDAATYAALAAQVYASYNAAFWNGSNYVDGVGTSHASVHANFFPLAFGLVPATNQAAVLNYIHARMAANNGMLPSVYGAQYMLQALFQAGDVDTALGLISTNNTRSWLSMITAGSTLTTEAWNFADKSNEDWNHPWGSAAGNLIQRFVLGLQPLTPGCGQILIQPQLGQTLTYVQGMVPTIRGPVLISVTNAPDQFQLLVNIPGNVTATVMLPTLGATNPVALVDGTAVSGTVSNNWLTVTNVGSGQHAIWLNTNSAPTQTSLYNNWAAGWFGTNSAIAGPNAEPAGDGVPNLLEYAVGGNPLAPDATNAAVAGLRFSASQFAFQFRLRNPPGSVTVQYQSSGDLLNWTNTVPAAVNALENDGNSSLYQALFPCWPAPQFFRIQYSLTN